MAANKDVTVIIFDVGKNAAERITADGPTFFEEEKNCVEKILLQKLFTKPKDEVSLLLIGTEATDNELNEECGGYENISTGFEMAPTNWKMVHYLEKSVGPPHHTITADWLDGIVVAMNYLKSLEATKSNLKIFLLTTFSTPVNDDNMESVVTGLKHMNIKLVAISSNVDYMRADGDEDEHPQFSQITAENDVQKKSKKVAKDLLDRCDGELCNFTSALTQLIYYDKKQRRRMPWNCDLDIGKNLAIKIAAYIFVREEKEIGSWKHRDQNGDVASAQMNYFLNDVLLPPDQLIDNLMKGYRFGETVVPYDDSSPITASRRSFSCIGFIKKEQFTELYLAGTGIWAVVPQKGSTASANILTALVLAMRKTNVAMVARYTYGANTAPKIMILFPNDLNEKLSKHNSLLMYELVFKQYHVKVQFPILFPEKTKPSAEQYDVIDKLIDSMNLMTATATTHDEAEPSQKSCEAFKKLLNPALQHMYRAIANRAINPKDRVLAVDKDLMDMLHPPLTVQERAKPHIEKVKELFELEVVKKTTKNALYEKLQSRGLHVANDADALDADATIVTAIGTTTPAEDFAELMNRGERFLTLVDAMQEVIGQIVFQSVELPEEKISKALLIYREFAKDKGPFRYNEWIEQFKAQLLDRGKMDAWQIILNERYGLITATESEISTVTDDEAKQFYDVADDANTAMDANENAGDLDAMFDDM